MLRRTILLLALAGVCTSTAAVAQDSRQSRQTLSDRFGAFRKIFKRSAADQPSRSRSSGRQPTPPMPYDPEDLVRSRQQTSGSRQSATIAPRVETAPRPSTGAESRTARRSPTTSSRQRELDEALADLLAPPTTEAEAASAERISLPAAADPDGLPDYLQGLTIEDSAQAKARADGSAQAKPALPQRGNPFDLHNVLVDGGLDAAPAEPAQPEQLPASVPPVEETEPSNENPTPAASGAPAPTTSDAAELIESLELPAPAETADLVDGADSAATSAGEPIAAAKDALGPPAVESAASESTPNVAPPVVTLPAPTAAAVIPDLRPQQVAEASNAAPEVADTVAAENAFAPRAAVAEPTVPTPVTAKVAAPPAGPNMLFTYRQPVIQSNVAGPRRIVVGHEATYEVALLNSGDTAANDLQATVEIPAWADVVDAAPSVGTVQRGGTDAGSQTLQWRLSDLPSGAKQTLRVKLIPRSGQPLQLGVRWTHAPVGSMTTVEVQEPKLAMTISGPSEVMFGKPQRFRLSLSNPGTGDAADVSIQLTPPGGTEADAIHHPIGTLPAGQTTDIELELVAREAGELIVQAGAVGSGGLQADAVKQVNCRKPELQIDWRGPEQKYAGTAANYYFRVQNPGTAATERFVVELNLPQGAELLAASEGHTVQPSGAIRWNSLPLGPGEQRFMQVRCKLTAAGQNDLTVTAETNDTTLRDSKAFFTNVIALADLKLDVSDPQGPIAVGEEALYTVRVVNRGTTAARNVNVVALFSAGIEPMVIEGGQYTVNDGRVAFQPITTLPAGSNVEFRIRAQASDQGTHVFRAEVVCQDLEIKLAAEETTRFFHDDQQWEDASNAYSTASGTQSTPR